MSRTAVPARKLITIAEAAEHCRVNPKTIRRWILTGRITAYRASSRLVRVDQHEIDDQFRPIPAGR